MTLLHLGDDTSSSDNATVDQADTPSLTDDEKMRYDRVVIRDEMSESQQSPTAARTLSAKHFGRLIYSLDYSPGVVEQHTAPYNIEHPSE
jgi:hypothetical protein